MILDEDMRDNGRFGADTMHSAAGADGDDSRLRRMLGRESARATASVSRDPPRTPSMTQERPYRQATGGTRQGSNVKQAAAVFNRSQPSASELATARGLSSASFAQPGNSLLLRSRRKQQL